MVVPMLWGLGREWHSWNPSCRNALLQLSEAAVLARCSPEFLRQCARCIHKGQQVAVTNSPWRGALCMQLQVITGPGISSYTYRRLACKL